MMVSNDVKFSDAKSIHEHFIWLTEVAINGHSNPHYGTLVGYLDLDEGNVLRSVARRLIFGIEDEIESISESEQKIFTDFNNIADPLDVQMKKQHPEQPLLLTKLYVYPRTLIRAFEYLY